MNEFKGTPGPWELRVEALDQTVALDVIGDGIIVSSATTWSSEIHDAVANANLIAAAPELLEALQCAIHHVREQAKSDGLAFGHFQLCTSAINKALGKGTDK